VALLSTSRRSTVWAGPAALTIVQKRYGNTVRDLTLLEIGVALHYAPHKPARGSAAVEREIAQVVSVAEKGK